MTELLGCPFCGKANTPAVFEFDGEPYVPGYEIRCDASGFDGDPGRGCGATSGWGETVAEATETWNRRASLPEAPAVPVGGWSYSINYGPDGEENYANLTTPTGEHVANIRTHHAMAIVRGLNAVDGELALAIASELRELLPSMGLPKFKRIMGKVRAALTKAHLSPGTAEEEKP